MCRGEAHGLEDRRTIPIASILSNSALATDNFSGERRRARACMGGPLVVMKCSTVCLVVDCTKFGVTMSGNSPRSKAYWSAGVETTSRCRACSSVEWSGAEWKVFASTRRFPLRSTKSEFARRKSAPNSGRGDVSKKESPLISVGGEVDGERMCSICSYGTTIGS